MKSQLQPIPFKTCITEHSFVCENNIKCVQYYFPVLLPIV